MDENEQIYQEYYEARHGKMPEPTLSQFDRARTALLNTKPFPVIVDRRKNVYEMETR